MLRNLHLMDSNAGLRQILKSVATKWQLIWIQGTCVPRQFWPKISADADWLISVQFC